MVGYLRFVLASLVVYSHLNYELWDIGVARVNQGVYAVFCFYLISGFFTAVIYDRFTGRDHLLQFYADRLLRILPTFWTVMLVVVLLNVFVHHEPGLGATPADYREPRHWLLGFLQPLNAVLAFLNHGDYPYGPFFGFTPVATLALEVQYFLIAPLFFRMRPWSIALLIVAITIHTAYIATTGNARDLENQTYRDLGGVLPVFLLGFLFYRHLQAPVSWWQRFEWLGLATGGIFLGVLLFARPSSTQWLGELALALITCPWMLKLAMKRRSSRLDHLAGYLSYGVFLSHIAVLRYLKLEGQSHLQFVVAVLVATMAAVAIHYVVERPVLRWRHAMAGRGIKELTAP